MLICESSPPLRPNVMTIQLTNNLDFFCKYPWERTSFLLTLDRIASFKEEESDVEKLWIGCKQQSYALHGFPRALQLFAFQTISSLRVSYLLMKIPTSLRRGLSIIFPKCVQSKHPTYLMSEAVEKVCTLVIVRTLLLTCRYITYEINKDYLCRWMSHILWTHHIVIALNLCYGGKKKRIQELITF